MAFDNARLYAERTRVAQTLRRSLMPSALPAIPGLELASFFRPLGAGSEVGGDFYDVFGDEHGCWLVVGDVCGKGAEAAALTGFLRHTTVAYARDADSPGDGARAGQPRDARPGLRRALRDGDPRQPALRRRARWPSRSPRPVTRPRCSTRADGATSAARRARHAARRLRRPGHRARPRPCSRPATRSRSTPTACSRRTRPTRTVTPEQMIEQLRRASRRRPRGGDRRAARPRRARRARARRHRDPQRARDAGRPTEARARCARARRRELEPAATERARRALEPP